MNVIDTSLWGEFRIEDVFRLVKGTRLKSTDRTPGDIPYVGASQFNNGITHLIANDEAIHPGGVLTVCYNGPVGTTFYQPEPFWATDDVNVLYPKTDISMEVLLFIAPIIEEVGSKYAYVDKWKMEDMAAANLRLPVTHSGDPDWAHMEQTMRRVIEDQKKKLAFIERLKATPRTSIDVSSWGEFKIGDLFDSIKRAKRRTINSYEPGDTPYVTNSAFNNGVSGHLMPKSEKDFERGQCISVNTVDGSAFWQEEDFLANSSGNGLLLLRREDLNPLRALYLCTAIKRSLDPSFTVMLTKGVVESATIKLPVDATGAPDWAYMESVMKALLEQKTVDLDVLEQLLPPSEESEVT